MQPDRGKLWTAAHCKVSSTFQDNQYFNHVSRAAKSLLYMYISVYQTSLIMACASLALFLPKPRQGRLSDGFCVQASLRNRVNTNGAGICRCQARKWVATG